jgi:integrase
MTLKIRSRSKETFRDKVSSQSQGSQDGFVTAIKNFENFSMEVHGKVDIIPDMKELDDSQVIDILQAWINWNTNLAPSTMIVFFSRVKKYLHYLGIKLDSQDVKNELEFRRNIEEEKYGLILDNIQTIFKDLSYDTRLVFTCQLSSLMRIGELVQLRKRDLILTGLNIIVKVPPTIAKRSRGRTTFFSKEASLLLRTKLSGLTDDDLVFAKNENSRRATINVEKKLRLALDKCGLNMRNSSGKLYLINTHSFRAFGYTKLSRHDPNFASLLAGHKEGLAHIYHRVSQLDEKLARYEEFEYELTIDQTKRDKVKIEQLEEDAKIKMQEMSERIESHDAIMKELEKRINQKD